jgi:formylglycine-generating enzyme required for sulfatase activity
MVLAARARQQRQSGDSLGAIATLKEALSIQTAPWLIYSLGRVYEDVGRIDLAQGHYELCLGGDADPETRARAMEGLARLKSAVHRPKTDTEMREDWRNARALLRSSTSDIAQKTRTVRTFLVTNSVFRGTPEYDRALDAERKLAGGDAFPIGKSDQSHPNGYALIQPGSFLMGSPTSEPGRDPDEALHWVKVTRPFWLKATEVTQSEWESVMGSNPSHFSACGPSCPVEQVSWEDAIDYMNRISVRDGLEPCYGERGVFKGLDCEGYRLPTEAEWEFAARAATQGPRYGELNQIAWHFDNSQERPHPVRLKAANAWGLHDMLGNVWEWVHDRYGPYEDGEPATEDPTGPPSGAEHVYRGGGWSITARSVRAANRVKLRPHERHRYLGFRPARSAM